MTDTPPYLIALEALSVVSVSFSLVFFIIVLILHLFTWKLRIKPPVQLFINTCIALLLLYTLYIGALYARTNETACTVLSTFLHYAFTVSYLGLLVQAIYMLLQGICLPIKHYPLIVIILCWVLPLFVVTFSVAPGHELYTSDRICIPRGVPLYVAVILPFVASSIASGVILIITSVLLARISIKSLLSLNFLSSLAVYLIFTVGWTAVLSKGNASSSAASVLEVFFLLTGGLLGFYTFLLYGIASSDVRNIWRDKFRCITERSNDGIAQSVKGKYKSKTTTDIELAKQQQQTEEKLSQADTVDTQLSPDHAKRPSIDQDSDHKRDSDVKVVVDSDETKSTHDNEEVDV